MSSFTKRDAKRHLRRLNPSPVCHYCTKPLRWVRNHTEHLAASDAATADHIIPKSKGGPWHTQNLVVSCWACNQDKAAALPPGAAEVK